MVTYNNKFKYFFKNKHYLKLKNSLFNYKYRKGEVIKYLRKLQKTHDVFILDIGSGNAPVIPVSKYALLADLEYDSMKYMKYKFRNCFTMDINNLAVKDLSIDIVVCSEVLEHIKDYKKALRDIFRILKPGGKMILTVPLHKYFWMRDDELVGHYRRFAPTNFKKELENLGFKTIIFKGIGNPIERILTHIISTSFISFNKSKSFLFIIILFMPIFILINYILLVLIRYTALITPLSLASMGLIICEKYN